MAGKATRGGILSSRIKSANVKFFPEGILGYLGGPFFALIPNGIINTFLSQYWVNVLGIESWNSVFLWLLPLLSSILIVIGNLIRFNHHHLVLQIFLESYPCCRISLVPLYQLIHKLIVLGEPVGKLTTSRFFLSLTTRHQGESGEQEETEKDNYAPLHRDSSFFHY